ncbi:phospholipid scramblase 1-like [Macrobrachium nipponense]|uniref:phospholipid scramblase 1-like n=1 Tax=Macrobrachium nipponense TaxID=159736 RepID=UPI0030C87BC9
MDPKTQYGMMMVSSPSDNYIPPGLEYLAELDQVLIEQIISAWECLSGCEVKNKYILKNPMGQEFLTATEDSNFCAKQCCGNIRGFELPLVDTNGMEVLRLHRPLKCNSCLTPCCNQEMDITANGQLLGSMHQEWNFCMPLASTYTVRNASGDEAFRIEAPFCPCSCGSDVEFEVIGSGGTMGTISARGGGCVSSAAHMPTTSPSPLAATWTCATKP